MTEEESVGKGIRGDAPSLCWLWLERVQRRTLPRRVHEWRGANEASKRDPTHLRHYVYTTGINSSVRNALVKSPPTIGARMRFITSAPARSAGD